MSACLLPISMVVHSPARVYIVSQLRKIYTHSKATLVCSLVEFTYLIRCSLLYLVISSVAPSAGSTAGGTTLTITGNYFDTSAKYPLKVNVGGEPCTILHSTLTTIHCQTPVQPASIASQYQGQFDNLFHN